MAAPRPRPLPVPGPVASAAVSRLENIVDMLIGKSKPRGKVSLSYNEISAVSSLFKAKAYLRASGSEGGIIVIPRPDPRPR